jgi:nitrite reductase/ring-hydroxylating ferredoxin subunit
MDMGPTFTGSIAAAAHRLGRFQKQQMEEATFVRSVLKAGDVAGMDSRCLHFGSANTSTTRRVLFYMTIRNPAHDVAYPNGGSIYDDLRVDTSDYYKIRFCIN